MAISEIYQYTLMYDVSGVSCVQTWFYQQTGGGNVDAAGNLGGAFGGNVFPAIQAVLADNVLFTRVLIYNIARPTDYIDFLFEPDTTGDRELPEGDSYAPTFLAFQFVSNRAQPGTRSSRKRFPIGFESDFQGNFLTSGFIATVSTSALGSAMSDPISNGGQSFQPVCVKRPINLGTAPERQYIIESFVLSNKLTTQSSRKK